MKNLKTLLLASLALLLSGCISVAKIESGDRLVGNRLQLQLDGAWNRVTGPGITGPNCELWTMEGLPIDQLHVYSGLRDGETIHPELSGSDKTTRNFRFKPSMQADEIVALFEGALTRDGSVFKLVKLEPATFAGNKGFRFEYRLVRKSDNVELVGVGGATVNRGELFAAVYQAPKLVFFPRHQAHVNKLINSIRFKG